MEQDCDRDKCADPGSGVFVLGIGWGDTCWILKNGVQSFSDMDPPPPIMTSLVSISVILAPYYSFIKIFNVLIFI